MGTVAGLSPALPRLRVSAPSASLRAKKEKAGSRRDAETQRTREDDVAAARGGNVPVTCPAVRSWIASRGASLAVAMTGGASLPAFPLAPLPVREAPAAEQGDAGVVRLLARVRLAPAGHQLERRQRRRRLLVGEAP